MVDRTVHCQKVLCLARRFESTHGAFTLASQLMRDLGSVVQTLPLAVRTVGEEFSTSHPMAAQAIRHNRARHVLQPQWTTKHNEYRQFHAMGKR